MFKYIYNAVVMFFAVGVIVTFSKEAIGVIAILGGFFVFLTCWIVIFAVIGNGALGHSWGIFVGAVLAFIFGSFVLSFNKEGAVEAKMPTQVDLFVKSNQIEANKVEERKRREDIQSVLNWQSARECREYVEHRKGMLDIPYDASYDIVSNDALDDFRVSLSFKSEKLKRDVSFGCKLYYQPESQHDLASWSVMSWDFK